MISESETRDRTKEESKIKTTPAQTENMYGIGFANICFSFLHENRKRLSKCY